MGYKHIRFALKKEPKYSAKKKNSVKNCEKILLKRNSVPKFFQLPKVSKFSNKSKKKKFQNARNFREIFHMMNRLCNAYKN